MRDRYNIQDSDAVLKWKYWENKGVYKAGTKYKVSEDGAWIVDPKGKRIARNITRTYQDRSIGLLWYGWYHQLERLQALHLGLKKRMSRHYHEVLEPLLFKILGDKTEATVWFERPTRDNKYRLRSCVISKRDLSHIDFQFREKEDPIIKRGYSVSWSENGASATVTNLPVCQQPQPQAIGTLLRDTLDYRDDLNSRTWRVAAVFQEAIQSRLATIGDNYVANSIIEFKIADQTYIFKRLETYKAWEQIGTKVNQVDLMNLSCEMPHGYDSYKYQRQWKKTK